jgi:glycosyltransferase involved in cell wall biosynthesis
MLQEIVKRWSQEGHDVDVLTSQPSYKKNVDNQRLPRLVQESGVTVQRMSLHNESGRPFVRIYNAFKLGFEILRKAMFNHYDVIMISTSPPVLGGWFAAIASKIHSCRFIYHCMDIHPEIGRISGEFSNSTIFRWLSKMDSYSCNIANPVVVLSEDMARSIRDRDGCNNVKIEVINNFSLPSGEPLLGNIPISLSDDVFTVLFAGNIGRFQDLDTVVSAMEILSDNSNIEFIFMGEGVEKDKLKKRAISTGGNVKFVSQQSIETAKEVMRRVDLGYVGLNKDVVRYAYPSKIMTYLEQGCPVLVAVEKESDLAYDVRRCKYGFTVETGDSKALAYLLLELSKNMNWSKEMKQSALDKSNADYSIDVAMRKWTKLLVA